MAWGASPVVSHAQALGQNGGTTSDIDTTGADTIFWVVAHETAVAPTPADSKLNTWTLVRTHDNGHGKFNSQYRSATPANVGTLHNFTLALTNGVIGVALTAFAGGATSSIDDQENSNGAIFSAVIKPGAITPSAANTLVITGVTCSDSGNDPSVIDSGFTIAAHNASDAGGTGFGVGIAYLLQGAAALVDPEWTITASSVHVISTVANYNAGAGGGGGGTLARARFFPSLGVA
jgi:hypothetical protein